MRRHPLTVPGLVFAALIAAPCMASQLIYAPISPSFQPGNPYAGQVLEDIASAQKKQNTGTGTNSLSSASSIAETVRAAVLSQISTQINNQIFGTGASGSFNLGDGSSISYLRAGGNVNITFNDPTNGQTVITLPSP